MRVRLPFALLGCLLVTWSRAGLEAACASSFPMGHLSATNSLCNDHGFPAGFAYQLSDPSVNTGGLKIICKAETDADGYLCDAAAGSFGDGILTVSTDWFLDGVLGCPISDTGPARVMIVVVDGGQPLGPHRIGVSRAHLVSVSGREPEGSYWVGVAQPWDPASMQILPSVCDLSLILISQAERSVALRAFLPPIYTDCDPGSFGAATGGTCPDDYRPTLSYGPIYTRALPCGVPPDLRREFWTSTGVTPDANGDATVTTNPFPQGQCMYVGSTTLIDGVETGILTGFVLPDFDCFDGDGDGAAWCDDCDDEDPAIHPGALEVCNGRDENCDGRVDEGLDMDLDGVADCFDNCPTTPNADQNPCACVSCGAENLSISFSRPAGRGSGVVTWSMPHEVDIAGFNLFTVDQQGTRVPLNPVLIPCDECVTGLRSSYTYIVPKHKSGRSIFLDVLHISGSVETFGPAQKI